MTKIFVCLAVIGGCLLIYACGDAASNSASNAIVSNATSTANTAAVHPESTVADADLAMGKELYTKNCANCHKDTGEGGPTVVDGRKMKPDNLTDDRRKRLTDDKYIDTMVKGVEDEGMPSFKDKLTDAEMHEIVRYIRVALQQQPDTGSTSNTRSTSNSVASNTAAKNTNSSPK
ncbi:MAG TPA: cytochrome c [Pyrinomonadaceae bacterium]|jgi:mono/diheme cytochrome c family protein